MGNIFSRTAGYGPLIRRLLFSCFFCFTGLLARSQWTTSGANIYNSNTGNVGIGITVPVIPLHVIGHVAGETNE